jgi:NAD(P)-dependent dehydrogenase (short-subunit alcohol dehydrogenase family)
MENRWRLTEKVALVTGGTKGIGTAIGQELLKLGDKVLLARRQTEIDEAVAGHLFSSFLPVAYQRSLSFVLGRSAKCLLLMIMYADL